eukprot:UN32959
MYDMGQELYKSQKYEDAANIFQRGLKISVIKHGELGMECAKFYLWYGKSLLNVSKLETDYFGNTKSENSNVNSKDKTADVPSKKPEDTKNPENNSNNVKNPTPDDKNPENNVKSSIPEQKKVSSDGELVDDRQLAWENIDIARVIWSSSEDKEAQSFLADCMGFCGEIWLENDNYPAAAEEFIKAAKLHEKIEGSSSRKAAGDYVSAAVGAIYANQVEKAYELYLQAITHLDNRIRTLIGQEHDKDDDQELLDKTVPETSDQEVAADKKTELENKTDDAAAVQTTEKENSSEENPDAEMEDGPEMDDGEEAAEDDIVLLEEQRVLDWLESNKTHEHHK